MEVAYARFSSSIEMGDRTSTSFTKGHMYSFVRREPSGEIFIKGDNSKGVKISEWELKENFVTRNDGLFYTGIGSRETPTNYLIYIRKLGVALASMGRIS